MSASMPSGEYVVLELRPEPLSEKAKKAARRLSRVMITPFDVFAEYAGDPELVGTIFVLLILAASAICLRWLFASKVIITIYNATTGEVLSQTKPPTPLRVLPWAAISAVNWLGIAIISHAFIVLLGGRATIKGSLGGLGYAALPKAVEQALRAANLALATRSGSWPIEIKIPAHLLGKPEALEMLRQQLLGHIKACTGWPYAPLDAFFGALFTLWMLALIVAYANTACGLSMKRAIIIAVVAGLTMKLVGWI